MDMSKEPLVQTTNPDQILNLSYPYEFEYGETKVDGQLTLSLKSFKIRGDSIVEMSQISGKTLNMIKNYLNAFNKI